MRYDRLFTKLFCTPLLLEAGTRAGFERVLLSYLNGQPSDLRQVMGDFTPEFQSRKIDPARADRFADNLLEIEGSTAIIHIDGAIDKNLTPLDRLCFDATDLNDVDRALARAAADSSIRNILLAINSPGGTVSGVPETGARIAELATKKNVFSFIDGLGCSAGYWLASQADQVFATGSATVGSIGVYLALLDETRFLEDQGLKVELIKDGKLKAAGASFKPLSDEERAHFQETVNQIGSLFRETVTSKRPDVTTETMQGQAFFGAAAFDRHLVDAILPDRAAAIAQF